MDRPFHSFLERLSARGYRAVQATGCRRFVKEEATRKLEFAVVARRRTRYVGEVRYRQTVGYIVETTVTTTTLGRLQVTAPDLQLRAMIDRLNRFRRLVEVSDGAAGGEFPYRVWSHDGPWAQALIARPNVRSLLSELLSEGRVPGSQPSFFLFPGTLRWGANVRSEADFERLAPDRIEDAMLALAEQLEAFPPTVPSHLTGFEQFARKHPMLLVVLYFGLGLVACGLLGSLLVIGLLAFALLR
ncbi:MAG: hypothetical protein KDD69_13490 [Bdellovibrionales bacterium]|nr:hypothetical protein [Bdellovibrionales bacterium]